MVYLTHFLPFDIWFNISLHLSVRSILSLRMVCKHLYNIMGEYSIWMAVLQDIAEVIPLRGSIPSLSAMSSSELQNKAVTMARLDELWRHRTVHPVKIVRHPIGSDVLLAEVMCGGDFILTLTRDGTLQLYHTQDVTKLLVAEPPPYRLENCDYFVKPTEMRTACSSCDKIWVLVVEYYHREFQYELQEFTDFRAYHIDISTASIHHLVTITSRHFSLDFCVRGNLFANIILPDGEYEGCQLVVRRLSFTEKRTEAKVVMNLGSNLMNPRIAILCSHMILVSHQSYLSLYRIPELRPANGGRIRDPVVCTSLVTYMQGTSVNNTLIWDMLCPYNDGCLSVYTLEEDQCLLILPSPGESQDKIVRYVVNGPCHMGYSHTIGCRDFIVQRPMELQCFSHFSRLESHVGYMRLGQAPHPKHITSIPLLGQDGRVEDLSWDEESGRIAVMYSLSGDPNTKEILVLYMI